MNSLQVTAEKMGLSSDRYKTSLIVLCTLFLILCGVSYKYSVFDRFGSFSKEKAFEGRGQNLAHKNLESIVQTIADSEADKGFEGRGQNFTHANLGSTIQAIADSEAGRCQNFTQENLGSTIQAIADSEAGRGQNFTHENLGSTIQAIADSEAGRGQNFTRKNLGSTIQAIADSKADLVSRNYSFKNSTKDSSPLTRKPTADKMLDGLLASGFDKTSCLSRFQSYLYRKASPHKPSPYLINRLRKYEDLHQRCGPHTRLYNKTMKELIRPRRKGHSAVCNYIVWTSVNGLGNRMVSMASAFLYALLTDRVLMVDFEGEMTGLFCEPFPNSSWILPNDFPFINKPRHIETYQNMMKKDRENSSRQVSPLVLHLYLQHTSDGHEKFFHCDHSQHLLSKVPLLILRSDQYFVPSLFIVPSFSQELTKMFPEKDTVFHHLGRYIFLPSNQVWGIINRFYQAYMARADERVGLQIRVYPDLSSNQAKMDQILRCTLRNKVLPELDLRDSVTSSPRKNQTKSVLVTSLYSYFGENLTTMYLKKPTVTGDIIGVYQPSHEEEQKFHDNMHNVKALTEIYLLSMCDVLVSSSISSFGYVAQGLGGLRPWILHKLLDNNIPDPPCVRDFSMEPCFHYPPKHDCMAKPMDENGKAFPYTRPCLDQGIGMKLVNDHE